MPLSNADRRALHAVLDAINADDLVDLSWDSQYSRVHGVGTSALGGYKLGSMKGDDGRYRVGIFRTGNKALIHPSVVPSVSWDEVPTGQQILTDLGNSIDAA